MPSVKALEEKQGIVTEICGKLDEARSLVLFNYRGLTDAQAKDLRIKLREVGSDYKVYKNTLLNIAFKDKNIALGEYLEGPTAIAFGTDEVSAVKVLNDFAKSNDALELKAGLVEGNVADLAKLKEFAAIPSREGLYTMLAGGMIQIVKDLSIALNLYAEQKDN